MGLYLMKNLNLLFVLAFILAFFLHIFAVAQDCFESSIISPTPFMGNNGELFKLSDGSVWEVKYEYEYLYECFDDVVADDCLLVDDLRGKRPFIITGNLIAGQHPPLPEKPGCQPDIGCPVRSETEKNGMEYQAGHSRDQHYLFDPS